jgi:hypothetical protein
MYLFNSNIIPKIAGPFLKILLVSTIILATSGFSRAQQVLLSRNLEEGYKKEIYGQNLQNFVHLYGGLGFIVGPTEGKGADLVYGISMNPEIGGRYKLRITRNYSMGLNLSYNLYSYKINQKDGKFLPDTIMHKAERFLFSNLSLGYFNRFNIGRTGNFIGKFIDIGVYCEWVHFSDHYFKDKLENGNVTRTHVSGLDYVQKIQYGVFANFGLTRYSIIVKYRLSNLFKSSYDYPELPRFTVGFLVGLHKVS